MRLNKNLFKSLNEASKKVIQPEIEEEVEEIAEANCPTLMTLMIKILLIMLSATTK